MFSGMYIADTIMKRTSHIPLRVSGTVGQLQSAFPRYSSRFISAWKRPSLSTQFVAAATVVLAVALSLLGAWISSAIETVVVQNTAVSTAFYVQSLIEPSLQPLAEGSALGAQVQSELDKVLLTTPLGKSIATVKVWNLDGTIVYSTNHDVIGKSFPETKGFLQARGDRIEAEFDEMSEAENASERQLNRPLLEVYVPVH
jgi:hypothetical protein